jgi:hypothetical protein
LDRSRQIALGHSRRHIGNRAQLRRRLAAS